MSTTTIRIGASLPTFVLLLACHFETASSFLPNDSYCRPSTPCHRNHNSSSSFLSCRLFLSNDGNRNNFRDATATTSNDPQTERAGSGGYSILRQPLSWDDEDDFSLDVPISLDEKADSDQRRKREWIQQRDSDKDNVEGIQTRRTYDGTEHPEIDLETRTLDTLDYPLILKALSSECRTQSARRIVERRLVKDSKKKKRRKTVRMQGLSANSVLEVKERYEAVQEMQTLYALADASPTPVKKKKRKKSWEADSPPEKDEPEPLGLPSPLLQSSSDLDLDYVWEIADEQNKVLEGPEILDVSMVLQTLTDLSHWGENLLLQDQKKFQRLPEICSDIEIDPDLLQLLTNAFDEEKGGMLSSQTFPELGRLRASISSLKRDILSLLDSLINRPSVQSKLALESGASTYSEINGRIVIPLQDSQEIGIVHDVSRSGKTVFVEPSEIVGPTNTLNGVKSELRREEAEIWRRLTAEILQHRESIERAVDAAGRLDLVLARVALGKKLNGVIPTVKEEGVLELQNAKHPVLLLRSLQKKGGEVVANNVSLGKDGNCGLVLTGPNSGGKTVILKLLGLMALMARDGIPIPASSNESSTPPRVDFFHPVLADIGDIQSVDGDLSTFSGHMLVCRKVLEAVNPSSSSALVLMDEVGSGTDPAQGVAIAQALLEALVDGQAKVAITTHYAELKRLANTDARFKVAGMQFYRGKPTYKLEPGLVGESFALAVAERLRLPSGVLNRANELLDGETRQMGTLLKDLEEQRDLIESQSQDLQRRQEEMETLKQEMEQTKERLIREKLYARRDEAKKFAQRLEEREETLERILERLKRDPSRKLVAKSWEEIRLVRRGALNEAEEVAATNGNEKGDSSGAPLTAELVPIVELDPRPKINVGDTLVICKKGPFFGKEALVSKVGNKNVMEIQVGSIPVRMKLSELALPNSSFQQPKKKDDADASGKRRRGRMSKSTQKALDMEGLSSSGRGTGLAEELNQKSSATMASTTSSICTKSNTLDLLGCNFEESRRRCQDFFSRAVLRRSQTVYLLHGHGTGGVLKKKLRDWLSRDREWVQRWKPADIVDGGDAFTQVTLKKVRF